MNPQPGDRQSAAARPGSDARPPGDAAGQPGGGQPGGGRPAGSRRSRTDPELSALRNLGPKSAAWLADVGIGSRAELSEIGAIGACRLLREAGHPVSRVMACAIQGALMDCDWRELPLEFRRRIAADFDRLRRQTANDGR